MDIGGVEVNSHEEIEPYLTTAELRSEWLHVTELHATSRDACKVSIALYDEYCGLPEEDRTFQRNRDLRQAQNRSSKAIDAWGTAQLTFIRNVNIQRAIDLGLRSAVSSGWL